MTGQNARIPTPRFKVGDRVKSGSLDFTITEVSSYHPHPRMPEEFEFFYVGVEPYVRCGVWEQYLTPFDEPEPSDERVDRAMRAHAEMRFDQALKAVDEGTVDDLARVRSDSREAMRAAIRAADSMTEPTSRERHHD